MNRILKAKVIERFGSQANFAQIMGVSEPLVSRVIRGRVELDQKVKEKWSIVLKHETNELFNRKNKEEI